MTFDELLTRDGPAVERFIKFRVDSPEDAEDILQDTLLAAFRGFPSLRDQSAFKPWLLEIARRKIADHFRRAPDTVPIDTVPLERLGFAHRGREPMPARFLSGKLLLRFPRSRGGGPTFHSFFAKKEWKVAKEEKRFCALSSR